MSQSSMIPPLSTAVAGRAPAGNETDPAKNLQLGQVILAKVLRVYQNGSYLVDLNGRQHVVDSAIPLRQEEVFRGKVVGLGERIVLEKMVDTGTAPASASEPDLQIEWGDDTPAMDLQAFVNQHRSVFDVRTWNTLIRAASRTSYPQLVLSASIFLHNLGLPASTELALNLARYMSSDAHLYALSSPDALHVTTGTQAASAGIRNDDALQALAGYLQQKSEASIDHARELMAQLRSQAQLPGQAIKPVAGNSSEDTGHEFDQATFQWLMNAQTGGAIAHRLVVVPFVLDGQLVELEMSLFDQQENAGTPSELKSRVIHLSLDLAHLGKINAVINAVNQNLRVQFSSDTENGMQLLASHNRHLTSQLQDLDYHIDELSYKVDRASSPNTVARPVMDLVVGANSLSVLA